MDIFTVANRMKTERKTIFDLEIRVTFYARVSTLKEEQENSIENQIMFFKNMIEQNPKWKYVEGYVDRARGETAADRKNFMRMIDDAREGVFDLILTKEVSRFARDTIDSLTYARDLYRAGVGVFFQNDNICTIDTDSEFRLTLMSSMAADEVRKLSERVRWGQKRSIEKGRVMGNNRIFGYDKSDCRLVINEPEAEMVRLIFNLYSTGQYSVKKLEEVLAEKGYTGRNGNRIHHNSISGIIQNPKYKGYYCSGKVKVIDYRTKEQRIVPEDEWILYKDESGAVPAIVDEELWDRCNEIFKERSIAVKSKGRSFKDKSVFTGKIWCRAHDKPYWRTCYSNSVSLGKPIYQWICSEKKQRGAKTCASISILETDLYKMLSDHFKNTAENIEEYIEDFLRIYKDADVGDTLRKQLDYTTSQIEKEQNKREKLLDLYTDGVINKEEFRSRNTSLSESVADLEERKRELQKKITQSTDYVEEIRKIESYFRNMYRKDSDMTKEQLDEFVREVVDFIDVIPINKTTMRLEIKLKTKLISELTYVRTGKRYGLRSGKVSKKMIESYEGSDKQ